MVDAMRIKYPGLISDKTPAGTERWRVRVAGNKARRITLNVPPDHAQFSEHYHAARQGIRLPTPEDAVEASIRGSIGWLVASFQRHLDAAIEAGQLSPDTAQYRKRHTDILRAEYGEYAINMPTEKLIDLRDTMLKTPGTADTFIKSTRALYRWAIERGHAKSDPTAGIRKVSGPAKGARPWTPEELHQYRAHHPAGTMAHLYLTLLMFTACRIGDAVLLGRKHERQGADGTWLHWDADKANAPPVRIPMAGPLYRATRAQTVQGPTYILNAHGKPFATKNSLGNRFAKWIDQAGLVGLSSHGVRKAAGELMAEAGVQQHAIMAIHGHTEAKTSEIYTKGANRLVLAQEGMKALEGMTW